MTNSPIRIAIVGCGGISRQHAKAIQAHSSRTVLGACADVVPESAKKYAQEYGVKGVYTDYRLMIEKERPDLVIVATWPVLHEEQVLAALALGVPNILCEKSLTTSGASAVKMASAAKAAGARLVEGVMCRHHPRILEAIRLVQERKIGVLRRIRAGFTRIAGGPGEAPYKTKVSLGGGVPFDFSCYCVNAFGAFIPDLPKRVLATWKRDEDGLIRELMGLLEYPDGTVAQLESSF